jgi:Cys-tRNA(Pro)/Cys-tRNA(Cys) deacylase
VSGRGTPALAAVRSAGVAHVVHEYEASGSAAGRDRDRRPHYGREAAAALGVDPARVFKTLVVAVDGGLIAAVVPVAGELDLKALAAACGGRKAAMADPAEIERVTGSVVGGISPLGGRKRLRTVVDSSAAEFATIFVSGGRRGLQLELAPADLVRLAGASEVPISRPG